MRHPAGGGIDLVNLMENSMHPSFSLRLIGSLALALGLGGLAACGGTKAPPAAQEPARAGATGDTGDTGATGDTGTDDGERIHVEAQLRFRVPAQWLIDESEPGVLTMTSPDETVGMSLLVVEATGLGAALDTIKAGVLAELQSVTLDGEPEVTELNGMPATFVDGHGVVEGGPVELGIGAVQTPAGKYLLMVGIAAEGSLAPHKAAVMSVLESIQPL